MKARQRYTHKGWFYLAPIWFADLPNGGCVMAMRWTEWDWPIRLMCEVHGAISALAGIKSDWPIRITGRLQS
ncbi:MAG: hypothetical protein CMM93_01510 [Rickettsiales bacterium]|nr:hypothetical protein [Rickettsiales bacterium]